MLTKTKLVVAAALVLGTASAALANDSGENTMGGYVLPGSLDGVNPAYHPRWFPQYGRVLRAYDRANRTIYSGVGGFASYHSANSAYAFVRSETRHLHRSPR